MGKRTPRFIERLERREMCAADWQNATNRLDVNLSGLVEPLDALIVINSLNRVDVGSAAPVVRLPNQNGETVDLT